MQTQYTLLYRYVNPNTNTPITGSASYEKTEELYSDDHKLNISKDAIDALQRSGYSLKGLFDGTTSQDFADTLNAEATEEREELIRNNMTNENKSNNLFIYTGTKKVFHQQYIPEQLGYVVRDWTRVPKDQIPDGPDDFSKHFVMLNGIRLGYDNAYLVCKPQYIKTYMKKNTGSDQNSKRLTNQPCFLNISTNDQNNLGYKKNSEYYRTQNVYIPNLKAIIDEATFFKWYEFDSDEEIRYGERMASASTTVNIPVSSSGGTVIDYIPTTNSWRTSNGGGPSVRYYYIYFNKENGKTPPTGFNEVQFSVGNDQAQKGILYSNIKNKNYDTFGNYLIVDETNIIRDKIPAHYEDTGSHPYYIKDQYQKIELSPWILHSVHNSLESSLTSAKKLVSMIGIENVKLIKHVPIEQFIKIK